MCGPGSAHWRTPFPTRTTTQPFRRYGSAGAKSAASQLELIAVAIVRRCRTGRAGSAVGSSSGLSRCSFPTPCARFPSRRCCGPAWSLGLVLVLLYHPTPSVWQIVVTPWLCLQVAAIPAVAGMYGVLEGWLAVAGSDLWWPLIPPKRPITAAEAAAILGGCDVDGTDRVDTPNHGVHERRIADNELSDSRT